MVNGAGLEPATTGLKGKCTRVGGVCIGVSVHGFFRGSADGGFIGGERGESCAGGRGEVRGVQNDGPCGRLRGKSAGAERNPECPGGDPETRRAGAGRGKSGVCKRESGGREQNRPHTESQGRGEQREPPEACSLMSLLPESLFLEA